MLMFSKSEVDQFYRLFKNTKYLRCGQYFYQHFKLGKVTNEEDKIWADRLYNADSDIAKAMIAEHTDMTQ